MRVVEVEAGARKGGFAPCIPRKARIGLRTGADEVAVNACQGLRTRPQSARPLTAQLTRDRGKARLSQLSDPHSSPPPALLDTKAVVNRVELILREEESGQSEERPGSRRAGWVQAYEQDAGLSYGYLRPKSQKFTRFLRKNAANCQKLALKPASQFPTNHSPLRSSRFRTVQPQRHSPHLFLIPQSQQPVRMSGLPTNPVHHRNSPSLRRPSPRFLTPAPRRLSPSLTHHRNA